MLTCGLIAVVEFKLAALYRTLSIYSSSYINYLSILFCLVDF